METVGIIGVILGYVGIMEKKMEASIISYKHGRRLLVGILKIKRRIVLDFDELGAETPFHTGVLPCETSVVLFQHSAMILMNCQSCNVSGSIEPQ